MHDTATRHLLAIAPLTAPYLLQLLDRAETYINFLPCDPRSSLLKDRSIVTLFLEASTRTQSSFALAARNLGAHVYNLSPDVSAMRKGETLIDTALTLNAMNPHLLIIRHPHAGAVDLLARKVSCSVINAGDGSHEHPTQALLDALTIRQHLGKIEGITVAICGDIMHSRVARSNIHLLTTLGARVRLAAPPPLMPPGMEDLGAEPCSSLEEALEGSHIVMLLRMQHERARLISSRHAYFHAMGLTAERLRLSGAHPNVRVMHPGPIHRGMELDASIADNPDISLIQQQVSLGVALRMAVLETWAS